jgi:uncharacterized protein (TIGR02466 family)
MQVTSQDLFPTRLWVFDIPELQQHHDNWAAHIQSWRSTAAKATGRSNRIGWHSDKTVFAQEIFEPMRSAANTAFVHAFKEMQLAQDFRFQLEAWVNLHDPGGFNMLHVHPHVLLVGSYYIRTPEGGGPVVFRDPRPGVVLTARPGKGVHCVTNTTLRPKEGQLVIFPHWLDHRVEPNEASEPRISIAINALAA